MKDKEIIGFVLILLIFLVAIIILGLIIRMKESILIAVVSGLTVVLTTKIIEYLINRL